MSPTRPPNYETCVKWKTQNLKESPPPNRRAKTVLVVYLSFLLDFTLASVCLRVHARGGRRSGLGSAVTGAALSSVLHPKVV